MEGEYETISRLSDGTVFDYSTSNNAKMVKDRAIVTMIVPQ